MRRHFAPFLVAAGLITGPAAAQLGLPGIGPGIGGVLDTTGRVLSPVRSALDDLEQRATRLADERLTRLSTLVRRNRQTMELDASGDPARRGELLLTNPSDSEVAKAQSAGFALLSRENLDTLGIVTVRLGTPEGRSLAAAEAILREILPEATVSADTLHFQSGSAAPGQMRSTPGAALINGTVGVIDGSPGPSVRAAAVRGFAKGAPIASNHGSAVVSLLQSAGVRRVAVADVYGTDPAGGNALAMAKGLNWLVGQEKARVISISLVGPSNPLLARAITAAQRRGVHIVAAVGNDGPAAPPSFPASYPGVIAVTAVDGRGRPLIEAGRASHLDYAAPGADILAANALGRWVKVRGTSYAAPLVAARAAAALDRGPVIPTLDREAIDLGRRGADPAFGRGLLCKSCVRQK